MPDLVLESIRVKRSSFSVPLLSPRINLSTSPSTSYSKESHSQSSAIIQGSGKTPSLKHGKVKRENSIEKKVPVAAGKIGTAAMPRSPAMPKGQSFHARSKFPDSENPPGFYFLDPFSPRSIFRSIQIIQKQQIQVSRSLNFCSSQNNYPLFCFRIFFSPPNCPSFTVCHLFMVLSLSRFG